MLQKGELKSINLAWYFSLSDHFGSIGNSAEADVPTQSGCASDNGTGPAALLQVTIKRMSR